MTNKIVEINPGERVTIKLPHPVGAVYIIEVSEFPGYFDIELWDEVNGGVLDQNTFML